MTRLWYVLVFVAACNGSDQAPGPAGPTGPMGATGVTGPAGPGSDAGVVPTNAPSGIAFSDSDPVCSELSGHVVIRHAADESDITSYAIYFGTTATNKLSFTPIAVLPATGADLDYQLVRQPYADAAGFLLVYAANAAGENPTGVAVAIEELGQTVYQDIGLSDPTAQIVEDVLVDDINHRLLALVTNSSSYTEILHCDFGGTGCFTEPVWTSNPVPTGLMSAVIDHAAGKLLTVIETEGATGNFNRPGLYLSSLTNIVYANRHYKDISAGQPDNSGGMPRAFIDSVNNKLLVVTMVGDAINAKPGLFRCNLDGTGCVFVDISAGKTGLFRWESPVIDTVNGKLLVATTNEATMQNTLSLFRCNLDGTNCAYVDISALAGAPAQSGGAPNAIIDPVNGKLLVWADRLVLSGQPYDYRPGIHRCELDGSSCTFTELNLPGASSQPSLTLDPTNNTILAVYLNPQPPNPLVLYRCQLDLTGCTRNDISAGQPGTGGWRAHAVLSPVGHTLLVGTTDSDMSMIYRPSLYTVCLR